MKPELSYASSLILRECTITTVDGETLDITDLVVRLDYFESISLPTIEANLDLVDTGSNIISSLPIQGYEDIKFTIAMMGEDDGCLLYTSPSPRDLSTSRMPSSA